MLGRVPIGKGCVGHARRSVDSFVSYSGAVPLLQTTVEVEDVCPHVAYKHTPLVCFFLFAI